MPKLTTWDTTKELRYEKSYPAREVCRQKCNLPHCSWSFSGGSDGSCMVKLSPRCTLGGSTTQLCGGWTLCSAVWSNDLNGKGKQPCLDLLLFSIHRILCSRPQRVKKCSWLTGLGFSSSRILFGGFTHHADKVFEKSTSWVD